MVSVVIASYNRANFVFDAIRSAQQQTLDDIEIIVVDDGSTDSTQQVLDNFGDSINVIYQSNQGRSAARNRGVNAARGDYIAFLDSDDIWIHDKLDKQLALLVKEQNVGVVHTFSDVVDENGILIRKESDQRAKLYHRSIKAGYSYESLSRNCIMFLSTVMVRRNCWGRVGPMDTDIPAFEDWDWYLRASRETEIATIPEVLVHFRLHSKNTDQEEFFHGRVSTCNKHLHWLDQHPGTDTDLYVRRNFYLQLAAAYYVKGDSRKSGLMMKKAIEIDKTLLFTPSNMRYVLAMGMTVFILDRFRQAKHWMLEKIKA